MEKSPAAALIPDRGIPTLNGGSSLRGTVWIAIRHERRKPGATHQSVIPVSRNLNIVCKNSVNVYRNPINVSKTPLVMKYRQQDKAVVIPYQVFSCPIPYMPL